MKKSSLWMTGGTSVYTAVLLAQLGSGDPALGTLAPTCTNLVIGSASGIYEKYHERSTNLR